MTNAMTKASLFARLEKMRRDRKEFVEDVEHYNRTHPDNPIPADTDEIDALISRISKALHSGKSEASS